MPGYSSFTNLFKVTKTLRFELKPMGKTWDNLEKCGYFKDDLHRAENYQTMKKLLNDYHRIFINECLSKSKIDWIPLYDALMKKKESNDDAADKEYRKLKREYRLKVQELFTGDERYISLFSEKIISNYVKPIVLEKGDQIEIEALNAFGKFSVYFMGFHENRKNIYDANKDKVSIPSRIVDDNFQKFVENMEKYAMLTSCHPELIDKLKNNLKINDIEKYFDISQFNSFITQCGIDEYNYIIEGSVGDTDKPGLNVILNLKHQSDPQFKKILFTQLYKQILGESVSRSKIPKLFTDDAEMISAIVNYCKSISDNNVVSKIECLFSNIEKYDLSKIYVSGTDIPILSLILYGNWETLGGKMQQYYASKIGDPLMKKTRKIVDNWLKKESYAMSEILESTGDITCNAICDRIKSIRSSIDDNVESLPSLLNIKIKGSSDDEIDDNINLIRTILDPYMDLIHVIKIIHYDESLSNDSEFYSEYKELLDGLSDIIPIFNKTRAYCTVKRYDTSKVKIKLGAPTLADGWDVNKERDNCAVILRKNNQYYLAVMNVKDKVKFDCIEASEDSNFEKMDYKLLPDPNKMLPKVFFSKSRISEFNPSEYIIRGREEKKMNKENFDLKFCHDLIDFYKESINKHEDWSKFNFRFSPTESYTCMNDFFSEIEKQNYKVSFHNISSEKIHNLVDEGKLFLFNIRNKDFSESSRGMPNLHTLYWKALFSNENLERTIIKLNGKAELFFRKHSIDNPTVHHSGTKLIGRVDKNGSPIPPRIYREILGYYSGRISELSGEGNKFKELVVVKDSKYDIIKDRRFSVDKMFFHVPISLNYCSDDRSSEINSLVLNKMRGDPDFKIIGIDRGERNLVYYCMIDRNGKIIDQGSFNITNGVDYHDMLNQREIGNKEARKNWVKVEGIKQLKEGYISYIVNKLSHMIIDNNAVLVMEDLNYGFKKGRFKIEKQIYQKFETMLIKKLNYLAFKDRDDYVSEGKVLNGYQLTAPITDVSSIGKQTGVLFYVPAAYTSKIDPTTGFVNLFNMGSITTINEKRLFLSNMDSIRYSDIDDSFVFDFDYRNYVTRAKDYKNKWSVYTKGVRSVYKRQTHQTEMVSPTDVIKKALAEANIKYDGEIKDEIIKSDGKLVESVFFAFDLATRMRVQNNNEDYIISPVKGNSGRFYCTKNNSAGMPIDADANGAYHIALKGELLFRMTISNDDNSKKLPLITNQDWFEFMQTGISKWKN